MVRAKFKVTSIERSMGSRKGDNGNYEPAEIRTVKLAPVYGTSEENQKFWDATPSGTIEIGCANMEAAGAFELGKEYFVDFTPAE